jgi:hypothetical protein
LHALVNPGPHQRPYPRQAASLTGEKFRAALGIAAPVDVAALAVTPIEFTERTTNAAIAVNVSFRMNSPFGVGILRFVYPRSVYPFCQLIKVTSRRGGPILRPLPKIAYHPADFEGGDGASNLLCSSVRPRLSFVAGTQAKLPRRSRVLVAIRRHFGHRARGTTAALMYRVVSSSTNA